MTQETIDAVVWGLHTTGGVTAKRLVEASRPVDAPLHNKFIWDNSVAAERYRESQALQLIASVRIDRYSIEQEARVFHAVRMADGTHVHKPLDEIKENRAWKRQVAARLRGNLRAAERDLEVLDEAPELRKSIRKYVDEAEARA